MSLSGALDSASTASTGARSPHGAAQSSTFASAHSRIRSIRSIPGFRLLPALDTCSQLSSGKDATSSAGPRTEEVTTCSRPPVLALS
jgi:hypothetical protein